ncbi:cytochrome C [Parendozoicomonas haliclonae]|uniref:Cytochrome C n=1 Tax=Parendozoicomonas haliclonae TaxID=1960125 RepID=A0A1X7AGP1_9GAMM|nr:cytochrome C [Parendozoicomonas haliclonae]SMA38724.1 hypothetical protein EHSB41UT_00918 [Parendozoicomonas haliclonae]
MTRCHSLLLLYCIMPFACAQQEVYATDPESGLIMAPGWELVKAQCGVCHNNSLIIQNPGSRETWRSTIQWMIDTQGLWDLSDTWNPILDYLSTYYGEQRIDLHHFRRLPLPPDKRPPSRDVIAP